MTPAEKQAFDAMRASLKKFTEYEKAMNDGHDVSGMLLYAEFSNMCKIAIEAAQKAEQESALQGRVKLSTSTEFAEIKNIVSGAGVARTAPQSVAGMGEFLADLIRSRTKYPNNARMWDGLIGEVDELSRAYAGDGDIRSEAFDVAVCAFRIATEGDAGGNIKLAPRPQPSALVSDDEYLQLFEAARHGSAGSMGTMRGIRACIAAYEAATPQPAQQEKVFAFRRKGLDDYCTCAEERYLELSNKPHLFDVRVFYKSPSEELK